ncbi:helix-turn-helix domain-containing protein [Mucilaginibacter sabulilitoris]|uniref:Helix-turn-helix domain-containing protein n=1 Tax=Mucilaginibacter sabulilitoris TaxID=1173583 RepID=A0ABZ0TN31_9SPHI|nr:helix-turn-helix domain-containing protein [Mucilaginibacter sabulilitoris]WPU92930.1 helix-turn-helix domain-containing protein [Mucilaginibacter sabulilitoris]
MKEVFTRAREYLLGLKKTDTDLLSTPAQFSEYTILFIPDGEGIYHADFGTFNFKGPVILFSTPLQVIYIEQSKPTPVTILQFHGDFYCIEYHRTEVACNGLLFNNIYIQPCITLADKDIRVFENLLNDIDEEFKQGLPSEIVLRSYLQLFLAKSSSIKIKLIDNHTESREKDEQMERFRQLLDQHYLTLHKPSEYAQLLSMSPNNFTKRCSRYFKKTPSQLIQERIILEAKKQLHLTRQSIKEIAYALKFEDEFYFSRFFKKVTKVSPQTFRDKTGISIVADLSK